MNRYIVTIIGSGGDSLRLSGRPGELFADSDTLTSAVRAHGLCPAASAATPAQ